jgi:hypothetical protein
MLTLIKGAALVVIVSAAHAVDPEVLVEIAAEAVGDVVEIAAITVIITILTNLPRKRTQHLLPNSQFNF